MSAKRRKGISPSVNFRKGGEALALIRARLILQHLDLVRNALPANPLAPPPKRRGRPRNRSLDLAVADYEFDVMHFDVLRRAGLSNVPADKHVLDVTLERLRPEAIKTKTGFEKAREALKDAIKKRRAQSRERRIFLPIQK